MKMSEAFPSNYLRASDFEKPALLTISHIKMEDIGDDHKPVLYFQEVEKPLVLNKTNGNIIANLYGDDSEDWKGNPIVAYSTEVQFQGKMVAAVRVRKPKPNATKAVPAPREEMNDEIPF